MAYAPKTPSRHRSRSEAKTPLYQTPSNANNLFNNSPTKSNFRADISNPFITTKSRPASPVKRSSSPIKRATSGAINASNLKSLRRQASTGLIRKGGVESRLDVVTRDYVAPVKGETGGDGKSETKKEGRRARSQPASVRSFRFLAKFMPFILKYIERYARQVYHKSRDCTRRSRCISRSDDAQST